MPKLASFQVKLVNFRVKRSFWFFVTIVTLRQYSVKIFVLLPRKVSEHVVVLYEFEFLILMIFDFNAHIDF